MCCFLFSFLTWFWWIFVSVAFILHRSIEAGEVDEAEVMSVAEEEAEARAAGVEEEQLGDFLLSTERLYDCFFVVGSSEQGPVERIGAVKACLMNQSRVFRSMLHDSRLAERGDILVPDIQPAVFRLLLKHCYGGLESLRPLTPEMTVKLCYVAEKYLVISLKRKVAERLKPECAAEVFPALHCLVTYNVTDLDHQVTEIIREQTEKVLSSEGFLNLDVDSVVYIVQQQVLNCSEVEIWRALIKWATNKVQNEEGTSLRDWMVAPLKHLRLMTLSHEDLCREVLPATVLTFPEFSQVCARGDQESDILCRVTEPRGRFQERWKWWETVTVSHDIRERRWTQSDQSYSCVIVGDHGIMLESVSCLGASTQDFQDSFGLSYPCQVEIVVTKITDYIASTSTEEPVVVKFNGTANYFELFTIPTLVNGESIALQANSMYKVKLSFMTAASEPVLHPCWRAPTCSAGHVFSHGRFYCSYIYEDGVGWKPSHILKFQYSYRR